MEIACSSSIIPCPRVALRQVHAIRRAARKGAIRPTVVKAAGPLFARLDTILREQSIRHKGSRIVVIATDDSVWLLRAFLNSRSTQWLAEVPLGTAVFVGGCHKSIVGRLLLDIFPAKPGRDDRARDGARTDGRVVKLFDFNGGGGSPAGAGQEKLGLEASISCLSFDKDSESCVLQDHEAEENRWFSLLGSTSLLRLWVPRVLGR